MTTEELCGVKLHDFIISMEEFHGYRSPGILLGGFMLDAGLQELGPTPYLNIVSETVVCLPDAVQLLGEACRQKPGDPAILFNLSVSLARENRTSDAQLVTAELAAIDSGLAERVRRYLQDGKADEAMQPMFELSYAP